MKSYVLLTLWILSQRLRAEALLPLFRSRPDRNTDPLGLPQCPKAKGAFHSIEPFYTLLIEASYGARDDLPFLTS